MIYVTHFTCQVVCHVNQCAKITKISFVSLSLSPHTLIKILESHHQTHSTTATSRRTTVIVIAAAPIAAAPTFRHLEEHFTEFCPYASANASPYSIPTPLLLRLPLLENPLLPPPPLPLLNMVSRILKRNYI